MATERKDPSFFLTTAGEYTRLARPRACWCRDRFKGYNRDDYMLVEIDPPLMGQPFGLGATDITELILSTIVKGRSLFPIDEWPVLVYVARLLDDAVARSRAFSREQVELVARGVIFPTREEAETHAERWQQSGYEQF